MAWSQERLEFAKQKWAEGFSAAQIARQLGDVTRNAVIGVLHRNGLSRAQTGQRTTRRFKAGPKIAPKNKPVRKRKRKAKSDLPKPKPKPMASGEMANTLTLTKGICRFPVEGEGAGTLYCGHNVFVDSVYCQYHDDISYSTQQEIKEESDIIWKSRKKAQILRLNSPLRGT